MVSSNKIALLAFALSTLTVVSCKKETSTAGGAGDRIVAQKPPIGYTFPSYFTVSSQTEEFKAYVGNTEVTNQTTPGEFLGADAIDLKTMLPKITITLLNSSNIEVTNSDQPNQPERANYFFCRDTLWVVIPSSSSDTFPFMKGNYNELNLNQYSYLVKGTNGSRVAGTNDGSMTMNGLYELAAKWSITDIDSIGYYNLKAVFK